MELSRFTENAINALSGAQECAKEFGHRFVGSEHLLMGIIKCGDRTSDLLVKYGVDGEGASPFIDSVVGGGRSVFTDSFGNTQTAKKILELAFYEAKYAGSDLVGTEHILLAIMRERDSMGARIIDSLCTDKAALKASLTKTDRSSQEEPYYEEEAEIKPASYKMTQAGSTPILDAYSTDLTSLAFEGKLDPVIGRDSEISRVLQTLCRRTKNNAVLIGDPGVGKSAVAEGIALRIAEGSVPAMLSQSRLISLDVGSMIAGTKYRGEFEERLKTVLDELRNDSSIILFIDEIHTIVGAGSGEGSLDAANIMKPALARGELRVIGATTVEEYRSFIEKDAALERRFTPILISEPDADQTREILKGLKSRYEKHHGVTIGSEAIDAAIELSVRYIADRRLPDKAIDLIDESCARLRLDNDGNESIESAAAKGDYELARKLRDTLKSGETNDLMLTPRDVARVISERTGLSLDMILGTERFMGLEEQLGSSVFGQTEAIKTVSAALRRSAAGLNSSNKPFASFVMIGPRGTGKKTLIGRLSEIYSGGSVVRLNGADYADASSGDRLIGAPVGYKDSEKGGMLTEFAKLHPVSVIMITSPEKLHDSAVSVLSEILENGVIDDGRGRAVSFRNAIIAFSADCPEKTGRMGFASSDRHDDAISWIDGALPSSVLSNIDEVVVFDPLDDAALHSVVSKTIDSIASKAASKGVVLKCGGEVAASIASQFNANAYGVARKIALLIEDPLSKAVLSGKIASGDTAVLEYDNGEYLIRKV